MPSLGHINPKTPKAKIKPTKADLAWAAGFIQGEGHIQLKPVFHLVVSQVELWPIEKLQTLFGGSVGKQAMSSLSTKSLHRWLVCGARGKGVIMTLLPFFSPRLQARWKQYLGGAY